MDNLAPRPGKNPVGLFLTVFIAVFLLVTLSATIITFILPEYYAGTARVEVTGDPATECQKITAQPVLEATIKQLKLDERWGRRYGGGTAFSIADTAQFLKARISTHPERNTRLIDITVYNESPQDAALIANSLAESYRDQGDSTAPARALIVDMAMAAAKPMTPNKPLYIGLGTAMGIFFGAIIGGIAAALSGLRNKSRA